MCRECDNRLGERGETRTVPKLATITNFPIKESLDKVNPVATIGRVAAYAGANISDLDINSLAWFGLGMFWKCAAAIQLYVY